MGRTTEAGKHMQKSIGYRDLAVTVERNDEDLSAEGLDLLLLEQSSFARIHLSDGRTLNIGRGPDCEIRVDDPLASRRHAVLFVGRQLEIQDEGSVNGTFVRGERIEAQQRVPLHVGDAVRVGGAVLLVRSASADGAPRTCPTETVVIEPRMRELYGLLERVAPSRINVLIQGETGAGKEVFADTIHRLSPRNAQPIVRINCAALSPALLESELFGHESGAFTGAGRAKPGLLEIADGGTVFLDEVGELSASLQVKLLRVVDNRELLRVGGVRPRSIDVRFVSATNRDLAAEVRRGNFREDLLFRLNGYFVVVPPLRERASEILPLAELFLTRIAEQLGLPAPPKLADDAVRALRAHDWPGNVRELRNVIECAVLLAGHEPIAARHLQFRTNAAGKPAGPNGRATPVPFELEPSIPPANSVPESRQARLERERIVQALADCNGNQTRAATQLGMPRRTLVAKLTLYALPRPRKWASPHERT
jgi:two-component system response regulator AtoC